jgi:hypothetical protein
VCSGLIDATHDIDAGQLGRRHDVRDTYPERDARQRGQDCAP